MARERLTTAEAALLNAIGAIAADPFQDRDHFDAMRIVIEGVLPDVDRDHPRVSQMADVAGELLIVRPRTPEFAAAKYEAQRVVSQLLGWRAACAHEVTMRKAGAA